MTRRDFFDYTLGEKTAVSQQGARRLRAFYLALAVGVSLVSLSFVEPTISWAAPHVSGVVVSGNARVERETILAYLAFRSGASATPLEIDQSIKALFQTGFFSDVQIEKRGGQVFVVVVENPLINKIYFEGNSEQSDKNITKEITLKERALLTPAKAQADAQRIVALYRRSGYYNATVEPKVISLSEKRVNLVFEVNEGKETKVEKIQFVGNNSFSAYQLRSVIATSESAWWKFLSSTTNYDPDRLNYDKELLRQYYVRQGFADFKVLSASGDLAPDGKNFYVTFVVDEGPRYKVGSVTVAQEAARLSPDAISSSLAIEKGQVYDAQKVGRTAENLTIEATEAGYTFTQVEPEFSRDPAQKKLDIAFHLKEGPRVYIERIDIVGNTRTLDEVIRRELKISEGDAYNQVLVERAKRRLQALDFFTKIDFTQKSGDSEDKTILVLTVEEKSTGTINFSAGYSTMDSVFGSISVSERNFLGKGQSISLGTTLSFRRQSVDFSFTEPYFLGSDVSAGVDAYATFSDMQRESSFSMEQYGGALRAGFRLSDYVRINGKYQFTHRVITLNQKNLDSISLAIRNGAGIDDISLVGTGVTVDDLDNPIKPTSGYRFQVTGDLAGLGGSVHFARVEAGAYYFMPIIYDDVVLKLKAVAGHIEGWNGEQVSVFDRYFKGGDTFRGFERSGLGPRMERPNTGGATDAIGGKTFGIGTAELTFPLGLPDSFGLEGAVFMDGGTVYDAPEKNVLPPVGSTCTGPGGVCKVFDSSAFRLSGGAGLIWQSPFGPLRLDFAWPIIKKSYDRDQLIQFSIATSF